MSHRSLVLLGGGPSVRVGGCSRLLLSGYIRKLKLAIYYQNRQYIIVMWELDVLDRPCPGAAVPHPPAAPITVRRWQTTDGPETRRVRAAHMH